MSQDTLDAVLRRDPTIHAVLQTLDALKLPGGYLVAGLIAQTYWNVVFDKPHGHGIADADIVYFDSQDVSEDGERQVAANVASHLPDLPVRIDVKNQARVHLWYEARFGKPIAAYRSTRQAIATYPTTATAIGVRSRVAGLDIAAPYGLDDLLSGTIRANGTLVDRPVFDAKVARWRQYWPELRVLPWSDRVVS